MALVKMIPLEEEFKKNPELKESDLKILRDWHKKQPHLPTLSDSELVLFLHSNYYRIEPTKANIDAYYTARTHIPELFANRDPSNSKGLQEIMETILAISLPGTTPEGYRAIYTRLIDNDPSRYVYADALKLMIMVLELDIYTAGTSPGYIFFVDLDDLVFGHIPRLNPMVMKKIFHYLHEAIPLRIKGLIYMNASLYMDTILYLIKPLIRSDLMDVVYFHKSGETSFKLCSIDILPNEQGGKAGPVDDLWATGKKLLLDHSAWFEKEMTRKTNEAVRPGKAKTATDLFGIEGSFRKLEID